MNKRIRLIVFLIICLAITMTSVIVVSTKLQSNTSKPSIIAEFNENKNRFKNIQNFAMSLDDNIYIYLDGKKIVYDESQKHIITSDKVEKDISYILLKLGYNGIYADDRDIRFVKKSSKNETGVYYIRDDIKPDNTPSGGYYERITKNWYYYFENPT